MSTTVVLPVTADTSLYKGGGGGDNYGITATMKAVIPGATEGRMLLAFDVSSIPTNAIVVSAILSAKSAYAGTAGSTLDAHEGKVAWIEGTKSDAQAGNLEPCWLAREADGAGGVTTAWGVAGGLAGTDYVAVAENSFSPITLNTRFEVAIPVMTQNWVTTPADNFGVWFNRSDAVAAIIKLYSKEAGAAHQPTLTVAYELCMTPSLVLM